MSAAEEVRGGLPPCNPFTKYAVSVLTIEHIPCTRVSAVRTILIYLGSTLCKRSHPALPPSLHPVGVGGVDL